MLPGGADTQHTLPITTTRTLQCAVSQTCTPCKPVLNQTSKFACKQSQPLHLMFTPSPTKHFCGACATLLHPLERRTPQCCFVSSRVICFVSSRVMSQQASTPAMEPFCTQRGRLPTTVLSCQTGRGQVRNDASPTPGMRRNHMLRMATNAATLHAQHAGHGCMNQHGLHPAA